MGIVSYIYLVLIIQHLLEMFIAGAFLNASIKIVIQLIIIPLII